MARVRNNAHSEGIMWMIASHEVSAARPPPWQLAYGAYLGQLEMRSDIHGLFYIPSEELWVDTRPGASFYVDGQWQQSSDPLLLVYTRDTWCHLEAPEAEGFFPVAWYREQLWGIGSRG